MPTSVQVHLRHTRRAIPPGDLSSTSLILTHLVYINRYLVQTHSLRCFLYITVFLPAKIMNPQPSRSSTTNIASPPPSFQHTLDTQYSMSNVPTTIIIPRSICKSVHRELLQRDVISWPSLGFCPQRPLCCHKVNTALQNLLRLCF